MTGRRARDLLLGVVLAAVSFLGVLYQVNESMGREAGDGSVPRLICPLH